MWIYGHLRGWACTRVGARARASESRTERRGWVDPCFPLSPAHEFTQHVWRCWGTSSPPGRLPEVQTH